MVELVVTGVSRNGKVVVELVVTGVSRNGKVLVEIVVTGVSRNVYLGDWDIIVGRNVSSILVGYVERFM